jgi:hypothetical protein
MLKLHLSLHANSHQIASARVPMHVLKGALHSGHVDSAFRAESRVRHVVWERFLLVCFQCGPSSSYSRNIPRRRRFIHGESRRDLPTLRCGWCSHFTTLKMPCAINATPELSRDAFSTLSVCALGEVLVDPVSGTQEGPRIFGDETELHAGIWAHFLFGCGFLCHCGEGCSGKFNEGWKSWPQVKGKCATHFS